MVTNGWKKGGVPPTYSFFSKVVGSNLLGNNKTCPPKKKSSNRTNVDHGEYKLYNSLFAH